MIYLHLLIAGVSIGIGLLVLLGTAGVITGDLIGGLLGVLLFALVWRLAGRLDRTSIEVAAVRRSEQIKKEMGIDPEEAAYFEQRRQENRERWAREAEERRSWRDNLRSGDEPF